MNIDYVTPEQAIDKIKKWLSINMAQTVKLNMSPDGKVNIARTTYIKRVEDLKEHEAPVDWHHEY